MHAPTYWKHKNRLSTSLLPVASLYAFVAGLRRKHANPTKHRVPIICIGNVVTGGSGKTPVALALGELLKDRGTNAHYLTRGYKGSLKGPVRVDLELHSAREVGDEPLLLARTLPTWVAKNRSQGAEAAIAAGAEMIVMDDGFQNPSLHKDISLLVIDGEYGIGNGRLLPSGPLREPLSAGIGRADAVIMMGDDHHDILAQIPAHLSVFRARIEPATQSLSLQGMAVLAFAGIARPRKFYRTLQQMGCDVRNMIAYPDHYAFKARDLLFLKNKAKELEAQLVTTQKDHVRLPDDMRKQVTSIPIRAVFEDSTTLLKTLLNILRQHA